MSCLCACLCVALIAPHTEGPLQAAGASSEPPTPNKPPARFGDGTSAWTGAAAFSQEPEDRWTAVYWIGAHTEELNWAS